MQSFPRPLSIGGFAGAAPWRMLGKPASEKCSFPGLGGAVGGDGVSSAGGANLLTRLSTEGLLGSSCSAPLPDLMLELRCGVGGGFLPPGLDILLGFFPGDPPLSGVAGAVAGAGGGAGAGAGAGAGGGGGGGGGGNTRLLSGGGGGKSGEGAGMVLGCHLGFAFTAGGDCSVTCAGLGFRG